MSQTQALTPPISRPMLGVGWTMVDLMRFTKTSPKSGDRFPGAMSDLALPSQLSQVGQLLSLNSAGSRVTQVSQPRPSIPTARSQSTSACTQLRHEHIPAIFQGQSSESTATEHGVELRAAHSNTAHVPSFHGQGSVHRNCSIQPKSRN